MTDVFYKLQAGILVCIGLILLFQSCGDPGFQTGKDESKLDDFVIQSEFIGDIVHIETPQGSIDLNSGEVIKTGFTARSLTAAERDQIITIFASLESCEYELPSGTQKCLALSVPDYKFTLSDGSILELPGSGVCFQAELCPASVGAVADLFVNLL